MNSHALIGVTFQVNGCGAVEYNGMNLSGEGAPRTSLELDFASQSHAVTRLLLRGGGVPARCGVAESKARVADCVGRSFHGSALPIVNRFCVALSRSVVQLLLRRSVVALRRLV